MVADFFRSNRKSRSHSAVRRSLKRRAKRSNKLEQLEPRYVLDSTVVFNELMYHPPADGGPEWIELHNQQGVDMDISNWRIDGGVEFDFAEGTILPQRGFLVISSDPSNTVVDEGTEVLGPFTGSLANNGEMIRLVNMNDREMDSIDYTDSYPWPVGPDGSGATLTKIDLSSTSTKPENWVSSPQVGGTPGERNFPSDVIVFDTLNLHETGDTGSVHLPSSDALGTDWTAVDFNEGAGGETWTQQSTGIGFFTGELGEAYHTSVLTDNPLGYWRFGETDIASPGVNEGTLGAALDGTYGENAGIGADSVVGDAADKAIELSGDATVTQLLTPEFEKVGPDGRTTEFWVVLNDEPTREAPLVGDGQGALDFGLIVTVTDESRIRVRMKTDISFIGFSNYDSERQLEVGEVVHVVANWSATTGESQLFLDGVEATQINQSGPKPNNGNAISTDNPIYVGRDRRSARNAPAVVDEVAVYDYLLAPDRIEAHFLAGTPKFSGLYQSEVTELFETGTSAYLRNTFELPSNLAFEQLTMNVRYDDGFVAYLNGQEVTRRNVTGAASYDSVADSSREFADARLPEVIDLSEHIDLLRTGSNVLAVHALNSATGDDDFLIEPELFALARELPPVPAPDVVFNEVSAASSDTFQVEFKNNSDADANLDGFVLVLADAGQEFTFAGTTIAPGELISLTEEDLGFRPGSGDDLYLYNADKTQLVDARRVTNRLRGRSDAHDGRWLYPDVETFGAVNSFDFDTNIVINEIMYNAPIVRGETDVEPDEQWVELYNRGDEAVDLTGWSFVEGIRHDFDPGTTIEPGGYLVLSNDAVELAAKYPGINIVGDFNGRLSGSGEQIELEDAFENPVDTVNYRDQGRWDTWADGGGSSIELRDPDADNGQPEAWQASDESDGGQWQTITYSGSGGGTFGPSTYHEFLLGLLDAGEVLIDDITVHENPETDNRQLIQNGTFDADTVGGGADKWRLLGTHEFGEIVPDPDDPTNNVLKLVANGPTEHMHNHAETTLKSGDELVQLSSSKDYEISFRARWLAGSDLLNSRLYFNRLPQTTALAMPSDWGTPGAQNSRYEENIGPTYTDFSHSPTVPLPGQFVNVTVNAVDADGIESMMLHYTLDGGETNSVAMTAIGGGQYRGQIPGGDAGDVFHFYVEGTDAQGAKSTFPARGANSRALYIVEDGKGSDLGVNNFRIIMLTADADHFHEETNVMSNARTGATIIYNGSKVHYDVGVRLKGSQRGRNRTVRAGFNVQFDPLDQFRGVHQSVGVDRSGAGDQFHQKEVLVKHTMNHAGGVTDLYDDLIYVVTPREVHTGSALLQMARYNSVFLDTMYDNGSDGDLFKYELIYYPNTTTGGPEGFKKPNPDSVIGVNVRNQGTKENHRWTFLNRSSPARDDYSELMEALKLFSKSGDDFYESAQEVLDVDQWLRAFAVTVLWGVGDNYSSGSQHNGYFYMRPSDGRMLFLPWDVDFSGSQSTNSTLTPNPELRKLVGLAENLHYYYGHIHDVVTTSFNESYMNTWIDHYEQFLTNHNFQNFKSYIRNRSTHALNTINNAAAPIDFEITTNDGNDITTDATEVLLGGNGWVDVREVRIAGNSEPLDIRWPELDEWTASLSMPAGENSLVLEAYNLQGELIGTDSITVTVNLSNPVAESLRITEINYHPHDATADELANDSSLTSSQFEFVEFANLGSETINPVGVKFTSGIEFTFPSVEIAAGERVVVVSDSAAFQLRYGTDVTPIGEFVSGKLANGGENLTIVDGLGQTLFDFSYNDAEPWPVLADGVGATIESDGVSADQVGKFYSWSGSSDFGGSPGTVGSAAAGVVINEVLAFTDAPVVESDSIELLNTTDSAIDIGGWYLSDAAGNLLKFQIPAGTTLGAGEYVVFDESDFNSSMGVDPQDFALSGTTGDDVYLVAASDGQITSFVDEVHFDDSANGESFGRIDGYDGVVPMTSLTLGAVNTDERVGPLVISEINYAGSIVDGRELEFLEIYNPSDTVVDLTNWRIRGGIDLNFDDGTMVEPGEAIIVLPFNPTGDENFGALNDYRITYLFSDILVPLAGGYDGQLSNSSDRIVLQRLVSPPADDPTATPYAIVDEVRYDDLAPWPTDAATGGVSLHRTDVTSYGGLASSWSSGPPTMGIVNDRDADLNNDGVVDDKDVDEVFVAIRDGSDEITFDLDRDGRVTPSDAYFLVTSIIGTFLGDANLDGQVDVVDLNRVGINWEADNSPGWAGGDFNGDGNVNATDLNFVGTNWLSTNNPAAVRTPRAPLARAIPVNIADDLFGLSNNRTDGGLDSTTDGLQFSRDADGDVRVAKWRATKLRRGTLDTASRTEVPSTESSDFEQRLADEVFSSLRFES